MSARSHRALRVGALAAFALACSAIFLVLLRIAGGFDTGAKYRFEAVLPDAVQLVENAHVRQAGVNIGTVTGVSNRGSTAVVGIAIDEERGPVNRNATVHIRAKTLVGESYVDLDPGTREAGQIPDGGLLPITQAKDSVELDEILSTLSPPRRARVRRLLRGLGAGFADGAGDLNATVESLTSAVTAAAPTMQALAAEREAVVPLVRDLGSVLDGLGRRGAAIRTLVTQGTAAARAVGAERTALTAGLRLLPSTLSAARDATASLARTGTTATPVADDLAATLDELTPAARDLPGATTVTLRALRRLSATTPRVSELVSALKRVARPAVAGLPDVSGALRQLRPTLAHLGPYAPDAAHFIANGGSVGGGRDATGQTGRVVGLISSSALVDFPAAHKTIIEEVLLPVGAARLVNTRGINPYPAPGTGLNPGKFAGRYLRVEPDPDPLRAKRRR